MKQLQDRKRFTCWVMFGDLKAKLLSVRMTKDGEPMLFPQVRSGAHVTVHLSGQMNVSDNHGFSRKTAWDVSEQRAQRAWDEACVRLPEQTELLTIPQIDLEWIGTFEDGDIYIDLQKLLDSLARVSFDIVTAKMAETTHQHLGRHYLDLRNQALVSFFPQLGGWTALHYDDTPFAPEPTQRPFFGELLANWKAVLARADELRAAGQVRPPKEQEKHDQITKHVGEYLDAIDWSRLRLRDHIRGIVSRVMAEGAEMRQVDEPMPDS